MNEYLLHFIHCKKTVYMTALKYMLWNNRSWINLNLDAAVFEIYNENTQGQF